MINDKGELVIIWCIDDVKGLAGMRKNRRVTDEQAAKVLSNIDRRHDCSIGINWDVMDWHIDNVLNEEG